MLNSPNYHRQPSWNYTIALIGLLCFSLVRIVISSSTMSHTCDEPIHVLCGIEVLDKGTYTTEALHPPLSHIAVAVGVYLRGAQSSIDTLQTTIYSDGVTLYSTPNGTNTIETYWKNVSASRAGILPFFCVAVFALYWLGSMMYSPRVGFVAAGIYSFLPLVLAHSSLATTDIPASATLLLCIATAYKANQSSRKYLWWILTGGCIGLALASKFSLILFGVVFCVILLVLLALQYKRNVSPKRQGSVRAVQIILVVVSSCVTLWGMYGFSTGTIGDYRDRFGGYNTTHESFNKHKGMSTIVNHPLVTHALTLNIPAPEFFVGIMEVYIKNKVESPLYFLEQSPVDTATLWLFFPLLFSAKLPLGFLVLTLLSVGLYHRWYKDHIMLSFLLVWFVLCFLLCMASNITIGLRHILPIVFVPCLLVGYSFESIITTSSRWMMRAYIVLGAVMLFESVMAHPTYLSWFNYAAAPYASSITVDSDIDWYQDVKATIDTINTRNLTPAFVFALTPPPAWNIDSTRITFFEHRGTINTLSPHHKYVGIGYRWLLTQGQLKKMFLNATPIARIGSSMFIYENPAHKTQQ